MPQGDDSDDIPPNDSVQPGMTVHPVDYPTVPTHIFPVSDDPSSSAPRSKRRQVKKACTNCQKACKKCDDGRPCKRCITYGCSDECVDTQRKERKRGIKRGPYKKREGRCTFDCDPFYISFHLNLMVSVSDTIARAVATHEDNPDSVGQSGSSNMPTSNISVTPPGTFVAPYGYPPGLPFIPTQPARPGAYYYIPVPVMAPPPPPPPSGNGQDGENNHAFPQHAFYPGPYFNPYVPAHGYIMPSQRSTDPPQFGFPPVYPLPPEGEDAGREGSDGNGGEADANEI
jgi:hypothetical protein